VGAVNYVDWKYIYSGQIKGGYYIAYLVCIVGDITEPPAIEF